ncbi:MAG: hypothetical protein GYB67_15185 [Chloroflexi bacterium]|nr:hypothetical protein [Chloroflexota bacterium]
MNLTEYLRILVRRGWIMVLLAVLAAGSAFLLSRNLPPVYRATQLVLVLPSRNDLGLAQATNQVMNAYVVYLDSTERAQEIIDRLSLDLEAGYLKGQATIIADGSRFTVQIDVDLPDLATADRVAREWGNLLVEFHNETNQTTRQEDRVLASLPDEPARGQISPNLTINTLAGALLGLLVGAVIVFVLEYLESSMVRRRDDLERALDLPVLAAIPPGERN